MNNSQNRSISRRQAVSGIVAAPLAVSTATGAEAKQVDSHPEWLARWWKAWDSITDAVDDTPQEAALFDELERLSILLCNTPARTSEGLLAQVSWMEADLGTYITEPVYEQHSDVFNVLKAGFGVPVGIERPELAIDRGAPCWCASAAGGCWARVGGYAAGER